MNKILELSIPDYITQVQLSAKRNATYYEKGRKKLPKKYQNSQYQFKPLVTGKRTKIYLVDVKTGLRVVANPKSAGTPKIKTINGQAIWNGEVQKFDRAKMMKAVKEFFDDKLKKTRPLLDCYPLHIQYHFYDDWSMYEKKDVSNAAHIYVKAFEDVLVDRKIIPEDNFRYISGYYPQYHQSDVRKLIVEFYEI